MQRRWAWRKAMDTEICVVVVKADVFLPGCKVFHEPHELKSQYNFVVTPRNESSLKIVDGFENGYFTDCVEALAAPPGKSLYPKYEFKSWSVGWNFIETNLYPDKPSSMFLAREAVSILGLYPPFLERLMRFIQPFENLPYKEGHWPNLYERATSFMTLWRCDIEQDGTDVEVGEVEFLGLPDPRRYESLVKGYIPYR
jgi:hypothetical protein